MSEEKKASEIIMEHLNKSTDRIIEAINKQSSKTSTSKETTPAHEHSSNVLFDCPECQKAYEKDVIVKATPKILEEQRTKRKRMKKPALCEDCGEVIDKEETEECPTCHGRVF